MKKYKSVFKNQKNIKTTYFIKSALANAHAKNFHVLISQLWI